MNFDILVNISVGLCAVDNLEGEYQELIMEDQHRVSISAKLREVIHVSQKVVHFQNWLNHILLSC